VTIFNDFKMIKNIVTEFRICKYKKFNNKIYQKGGVKIMAKDSEGKKFNRIPAHTKVVDGKKVEVREHIRSNRSDSKGKK
jgi:hypothetical protein